MFAITENPLLRKFSELNLEVDILRDCVLDQCDFNRSSAGQNDPTIDLR